MEPRRPWPGGVEAAVDDADKSAADATVRDRRRRTGLAAGVGALAVVAVAVALLPGRTGDAGAQRIEIDDRIRPAPAPVTPPTPPDVVVVRTNGRVVQLAGSDGHPTADVGVLPGSPFAPGGADLSIAGAQVYAAARQPGAHVTAFVAVGIGNPIVAGHSPTVANDGALAWVDDTTATDALVVRRAGSERRWPVTDAATHLSSPSWSPDGQRLVFEVDGAVTGPEVRLLDVAADTSITSARRLGPWQAPRWLPDGDLVVLDATATLVTIVDPDSMQSLSNRVEGAPAASVDVDDRGDLLTVHTDGTLTVNGRVIATEVAAAAWRP